MLPWLIAALIVTVDQLSKWAIRTTFLPQQSLPILPGIVHLTYARNTGAAFSLFQGHVIPLVLISVVVAGWMVWELLRRPHTNRHTPVALGLILGGAVGNLIDRLRFGYVEDFIDVRVWPVFNVADSAITIGVIWLIWGTLKNQRNRGHKHFAQF
ncbi:MAG: signal peptidase II [Candidatus Omnitrophica bacterium]|nr:signal peptidase II [Candidatus Omnitrophota bacterium]